MVCDPIEPQVVSQSGGVADHGGQMEALGMAFPKPSVDLAEIRRNYHAAVEEEHQHKR